MPPRSRGSIRTRRSERMSGPAWPASPTRVSVATVIEVSILNAAARFHQFWFVGQIGFRVALEFSEDSIGHLDSAGRTLPDGVDAARNAHHIVRANLAFLHYPGNCLADPRGLFGLPDMLKHHDSREEHGDGIDDRRIEFRVLGRRAVGGLEDGDFVPNIAGRSKAQSADQPREGVRDDVTKKIGG